jgi:Uma2 family endonuclease
MSGALRLAYAFEDYIRFERETRYKHEFVNGAIVAMASRSIEHAARCAAVLGMLGEKLRGRRCRTYDSNARIRISTTGNAYYPDVSVVCGALETDPVDALSIVNPTVLVEVLSPTTANYDQGDKLADYERIPTLKHVVFVRHDMHRIDVYTRKGASLSHASFGPGESARLAALDVTLVVDEIYFDPLAAAEVE